MNFQILTAAVLGGITAVFASRFITRWLCGFPNRTAKDVVPFLRKLDMELVYGTFHPDVEEEQKTRMSPREFKTWQWKRIHLAIHYCTDMPFNCWLFLGWIRAERKAHGSTLPTELQTCIHELQVACMRCRMASFIIRTRLRLFLWRMALLPFLDPPTFKSLLTKGSPDLVSFYETARVLAESFSLAYGEEFHEEFAAAL
jgi:hypothetical protein